MDTHKLAKETNEFQNERKSLSLDSGSFFLQFQQNRRKQVDRRTN